MASAAAPNAHALIPSPSRELDAQVRSRLLEPARRAGYELPVIGMTEEPTGELPYQDPMGRWWVFNHHLSDPTAEQYGGVVVPDDVRKRLVRLLEAGFDPDLVWVGHELPPAWSPGDPMPDLVPAQQAPSARLPQLSSMTPERRVALAQGAGTLGRGAFVALKGIAMAAVAVGAAVGAALSSVDPIIIAGVRDPRTGAVCWVEVERWAW